VPLRSPNLQALAFSLVLAVTVHAADSGRADSLTPALKSVLATASSLTKNVRDAETLRAFYTERRQLAVWVHATGPKPAAQAVINLIAEAEREGLVPESYNLAALVSRERASDAATLSELDVMLSEAVLRYARDMNHGRVAPEQFDRDWKIQERREDDLTVLRTIATAPDPAAVLRALAPPHESYGRLRELLAEYREVAQAGGWPSIPVGPVVKPGAADERIPTVRLRLMISGDLPISDSEDQSLDDSVSYALKRFQQRHGIPDDGSLGTRTVAALNVPADARVRQIIANMERWRFLPRQFEATRIMVNIPEAQFDLFEAGQPVLSMRTVVGAPDTPTPVMRSGVNSITVNPTWTLPTSIVNREVLPRLKKDPGYLVAQNIRILDAYPEDSPEAQGIGIDWNRYRRLPFSLRQMPGDNNALGRLKFNMPNPDDIYLHDTPSRQFFSRASRSLSHGCVRLEQPMRLAEYLLGKDGWSSERLANLTADGTTQIIMLRRPIPVYLLYWTTWIANDGSIQFRDDVYGRDSKLLTALRLPKSNQNVAQNDR
jgi:murein L,D-transpeptidase YcbB/YkuD